MRSAALYLLVVILVVGSFYAGYSYRSPTTVTETSTIYSTSTVTLGGATRASAAQGPARDTTPRIGILVAMPSEAKYVLEIMRNKSSFHALGYNFTTGTIAGKPVVLVISGLGEEAAAGAVVAAHTLFSIKWFVNIGTSGGHSPDHDTGDVIVAARIVPYGSRRYSSYTEWRYMRLGAMLPNGTWVRFLYLNCSSELLRLAEEAASQIRLPLTPPELIGRGQTYHPRIVLNGTIASSDIWTANKTYIERIHNELGTDAEEMEAYGFGLACYKLSIPFIKIAVISNNELTGSPWKPESIAVSMRNGVLLLEKMIEISP